MNWFLSTFTYWSELVSEIRIWWIFRSTARQKENIEKLNETDLRVDWLGRIYGVINMPEEVVGAAPQVQQQLQQQPQQVIIKVVQDKPSTATAVKYTPAKVHPQQRLISKASLLSNNGMTNNRQQFQQPQQKNINSNSNRNNLALLDVKSKSKSKVKEPSGVYDGNYLASWPPPQGTQQHLMTPLLGNAVAPAVPPP